MGIVLLSIIKLFINWIKGLILEIFLGVNVEIDLIFDKVFYIFNLKVVVNFWILLIVVLLMFFFGMFIIFLILILFCRLIIIFKYVNIFFIFFLL